jgi:hypothetical protein
MNLYVHGYNFCLFFLPLKFLNQTASALQFFRCCKSTKVFTPLLEKAFILNFIKQNSYSHLIISNKTPNIVSQINKG